MTEDRRLKKYSGRRPRLLGQGAARCERRGYPGRSTTGYSGYVHSPPFCVRLFPAAWGTLLKRSEIDNFRIHDLRHCFASFMAMGGANQIEIKEALRHSTLEMSARYMHLSDNHLNESVKLVDKFVDAPKKKGLADVG